MKVRRRGPRKRPRGGRGRCGRGGAGRRAAGDLDRDSRCRWRSGRLRSARQLRGDAGSRSVAIGDLDGDPTTMSSRSARSRRGVGVFGNGDGTFALDRLGTRPVPAVGDRRSRRRPRPRPRRHQQRSLFDYDDTSVSVLLNHGDGTFAPDVVTRPTSARSMWSSRTSTVTVTPTRAHPRRLPTIGLSAGRVSVMLGNGAGGSRSATRPCSGPAVPALRSAVGEVTGDAHVDIVVIVGRRVAPLVGARRQRQRHLRPARPLRRVPAAGPPDRVAVAIGDLDSDRRERAGRFLLLHGHRWVHRRAGVAADGTVIEATTYLVHLHLTDAGDPRPG